MAQLLQELDLPPEVVAVRGLVDAGGAEALHRDALRERRRGVRAARVGGGGVRALRPVGGARAERRLERRPVGAVGRRELHQAHVAELAAAELAHEREARPANLAPPQLGVGGDEREELRHGPRRHVHLAHEHARGGRPLDERQLGVGGEGGDLDHPRADRLGARQRRPVAVVVARWGVVALSERIRVRVVFGRRGGGSGA
mmetsp:Transcript_13557/g.56736  ORF Transcript_13557/g.56736 Transcript_13557/m.56736 type:complete len:201 (+) Transcript_13557:1058-1660(+)